MGITYQKDPKMKRRIFMLIILILIILVGILFIYFNQLTDISYDKSFDHGNYKNEGNISLNFYISNQCLKKSANVIIYFDNSTVFLKDMLGNHIHTLFERDIIATKGNHTIKAHETNSKASDSWTIEIEKEMYIIIDFWNDNIFTFHIQDHKPLFM